MADRGTDDGPGDVGAGRPPAWPWLTALAVALVAAGLLAWRPWSASSPGADAGPGAGATATSRPSPDPGPTAEDPGPDDPVFDAGTVATLFLTDDELAEAVPGAAGMSLADADEAEWGLPEGSTVTPAACTTAVTVVEQEPEVFARQFASDATVTVIQSVDLLAHADAARSAFDALVGVLTDCAAYQQVNPGVDGGSWTAQAPTTSDGAVATTVRRTTLTAEGATSPEVEVTALVGNALVTTTASGVDPATDPADPATLAAVARASGERALAALPTG